MDDKAPSVSWRKLLTHACIAGIITPAMLIAYPLGMSAPLNYFASALVPGLLMGIVSAALGANVIITILGAALCGLAYPFGLVFYGVLTGQLDAPGSMTDADMLLNYLVGMLFALIVGVVPAVIARVLRRHT